MEITTKFDVGDTAYYLSNSNKLQKGKIEEIEILIKDEDTVYIRYRVSKYSIHLYQNELFKDFEDFTNHFQVKFIELDK